MLTVVRETDRERVLTVHIDDAVMDTEVLSTLESVLNDVEHDGIENFVLQFSGNSNSVAGDFPSWRPGPVRSDIRFFARWDETLARISRLKTKTFAAYDGRAGAAAVHVGLVMDLRLASAPARLALGSLADGRFPGMGAHWLPKFIGLGNARKLFLVGEDLPAKQAAELGLVDVVEDTLDAVVEATLKATRPITPEAAYFSRRILDDCYLLEHSEAVERVKAARFKLGMRTMSTQRSPGLTVGRSMS